jgi:hypothetical protein
MQRAYSEATSLWRRRNSQHSISSRLAPSAGATKPRFTCKIKSMMPRNLINDLFAGCNSTSLGASTSTQCRSKLKRPRNSEQDPFKRVGSSARTRRWSKMRCSCLDLILSNAGNCQELSTRKASIFPRQPYGDKRFTLALTSGETLHERRTRLGSRRASFKRPVLLEPFVATSPPTGARKP